MKVKMIRSFHLSDDQTQKLAQGWRAWCRRRKALDKKLAIVGARIQQLLPDAEDLQLGLLSASMHVPQDADTPVETAPGCAYACMEPQVDVARIAKTEPHSSHSMQHTVNMRGFSKLAIDAAAASSQGSAFDDTFEESEGTEEKQQFMYNVYDAPDSCCKETMHTGQSADCVVSGSDLDLDTTNSSSMHEGGTDAQLLRHAQQPTQPSQDDLSKNALLLQLVEEASTVHAEAAGATVQPQRVQHSKTCSHATRVPTTQCASGTGTPTAQHSAAATCCVRSISHHATAGAAGSALFDRAQLKRLLGESGAGMRAVELAVAELLAFSYSDFLLIKHSTVFVFGLTPVRFSSIDNLHFTGFWVLWV